MTRIWSLYEEYLARQEFAPSQRRVAKRIGMSPTAFGNWQHATNHLPRVENLLAFADLIRIPYPTVLDAALHDAGYLPETQARTSASRHIDEGRP